METLSQVYTLLLSLATLVTDFRTYGQAQHGFCFPVIGDFGGLPYAPYTTTTQKRISENMAKVAERGNCQFVVGLGDNFYHTGVRHEEDPRFQLTFERVYTSPALHVPWYIIAGNHDHITNVSAQVAYSKKSRRWHFPNLYYSKVHKIPAINKEIHIVMIDTTVLCHNSKRHHKTNSPKVQLQWIEKELRQSKSDYLLVAGHHPILSAGVHGNTDCLVRKLKPLLEKHSVSAYFSGHDHNLQHIHDPSSNLNYFVSGSGNFFNGWAFNKHHLPRGSLKFFHGMSGGFAYVDITNNGLQLRFINELDKTMYQTIVKPRRNNQLSARSELLLSILRAPFKALSKLFARQRKEQLLYHKGGGGVLS